jgi:NAD(P)-dependent dehydrogenase (short-subunit alcohol dehydrogenase family)
MGGRTGRCRAAQFAKRRGVYLHVNENAVNENGVNHNRGSDTASTIAGSTLLVTGANRGIGRALVEEALHRGARRVYAGARQQLPYIDARVAPLTLDVTDPAQIRAAAAQVDALDLLINNAGLGRYDDLSDRAELDRHLAVNLYGPYELVQAFRPQLVRSRGAIVSVLSIGAWAAIPVMPAYSISKAAAFALSQALRALLAREGVRVHAVLAGPADTDMTRDLDIAKAARAALAAAILDGVQNQEEEIFPDRGRRRWRPAGGPAR